MADNISGGERSGQVSLLAVFPDLEPAADAIQQLHNLGVSDSQMNVISGVPVSEAMLGRPSQWTNVPRIALGGAILGFCAGFFLTFVSPYLYPYPVQVNTQPFVPGPPTFVLLFELTMLGMLLSTFLGVFLDSFFPNYRPMEYVKEVSDGKIAVFFICPKESRESFTKAMTALGAEKVEVAEVEHL
ncbi:MAG TPA: quinol:electron acceptor oxidoreductase subunit ActD [Anaerolineales bacterium]|nr:quinol:electron acceptor oxidoreductase subunit ActD [Anaerolineales bacterium]